MEELYKLYTHYMFSMKNLSRKDSNWEWCCYTNGIWNFTVMLLTHHLLNHFMNTLDSYSHLTPVLGIDENQVVWVWSETYQEYIFSSTKKYHDTFAFYSVFRRHSSTISVARYKYICWLICPVNFLSFWLRCGPLYRFHNFEKKTYICLARFDHWS